MAAQMQSDLIQLAFSNKAKRKVKEAKDTPKGGGTWTEDHLR